MKQSCHSINNNNANVNDKKYFSNTPSLKPRSPTSIFNGTERRYKWVNVDWLVLFFLCGCRWLGNGCLFLRVVSFRLISVCPLPVVLFPVHESLFFILAFAPMAAPFRETGVTGK